MQNTGAFFPSPVRTGASADTLIEYFLKFLNESLGTAYIPVLGSAIYKENLAIARLFASVVAFGERFGNQADPHKLTDFLDTWERIFNIKPKSSDSETKRRENVAFRMSLFGMGSDIGSFTRVCQHVLPNTFDHIELIPSTLANTHVPLGANVPGGINVPADGLWSSTISHILVVVKKPLTMTENEFYSEVGQLYNYASLALPAWATFDWVRNGPMGIGFYLDDKHNLDNERFD